MGLDCLWNGEENNVGDLNHPVPGDLNRDKLTKGLNMDGSLKLSLIGLSLVPLEQDCLEQKNISPGPPGGSLVP